MADLPDAGSAAAPEIPGAAPGPTIDELQRAHGGPLTPWVRRITSVLHAAAGLTMLALLAWTVTDIIGRSFFSRPLRGTVELTELGVVILVYLGLARTESQDAHISVDLLYLRLGPRTKLALRVLAGAIGFVVISIMTWRLYLYAGQLDAGGYTTGILRLPLSPVAMLGVLGSGMFALVILFNLVVVLRALVTRR
ncbi:TRAP transporter small permease [Nitriliruptor alkaliphilus]|uniref:TRAP transporter small permease n=1 Tax=Nitriliruptor alkaliphilus TaxID=427918 RepID=UPI000695FF94|nr:TRAP transporter small permease [Nitriliruptor alkaliphilus]